MEQQIQFLLQNFGFDDQRTEAWHLKRNERITASEVWKSFSDASASSRKELIMSKLIPKTQESGGAGIGALIWGTRFEPIAKNIYSIEKGVEIKDLSCVPHSEYNFIGASPDGLILSQNKDLNGRLIEFKCPISRKFDNNTPVPIYYYHQMQLQMECTNLNECDYVEMQFLKLNYSEWYESTEKYKSCFAVHNHTQEVRYKSFNQPLEEWVQTLDMEWQIIYWSMKTWRCLLVQRDPEWFPKYLPQIKSTWEEILEYKKTNTFPKDSKCETILHI